MTLHLRDGARASPTRSLLGTASAWHHKVLATVQQYATGTLHPFLCMFAATVINSKAF